MWPCSMVAFFSDFVFFKTMAILLLVVIAHVATCTFCSLSWSQLSIDVSSNDRYAVFCCLSCVSQLFCTFLRRGGPRIPSAVMARSLMYSVSMIFLSPLLVQRNANSMYVVVFSCSHEYVFFGVLSQISDFSGLHVSIINIASHLWPSSSHTISSILSLESVGLVFFCSTMNVVSLLFFAFLVFCSVFFAAQFFASACPFASALNHHAVQKRCFRFVILALFFLLAAAAFVFFVEASQTQWHVSINIAMFESCLLLFLPDPHFFSVCFLCCRFSRLMLQPGKSPSTCLSFLPAAILTRVSVMLSYVLDYS